MVQKCAACVLLFGVHSYCCLGFICVAVWGCTHIAVWGCTHIAVWGALTLLFGGARTLLFGMHSHCCLGVQAMRQWGGQQWQGNITPLGLGPQGWMRQPYPMRLAPAGPLQMSPMASRQNLQGIFMVAILKLAQHLPHDSVCGSALRARSVQTIARDFCFLTSATNLVQKADQPPQAAAYLAARNARCGIRVDYKPSCSICKPIRQQDLQERHLGSIETLSPLSRPQHPYLSPASSLMGVTCRDIIAVT